MKSEIPLREEDKDLILVLEVSDNDGLDTLVKYITQKGELTSELEFTEKYNKYYPDHKKYVYEIAAEIQKFGGNSIVNMFRGGKGVLYKEIVCDVADRLKVNYNKKQPIDFIEMSILFKILEKTWEKFSEEEKKQLLYDISKRFKNKPIPKSFPVQTLQFLIRKGGFESYRIALKITLRVANEIAKFILGEGLSLATNATIAKILTKGMSWLSGPIGWTITIMWTVFDIAGPAYRVTVPCVIHIAMLRQLAYYTNKLNPEMFSN